MNRMAYNMDALAIAGKRWFAKPPEGFEYPSFTATSDISIYASLLASTPAGASLGEVFARLEEPELSTRLTYVHTIQQWLKQNGPTIFVDPDMYAACQQTDVLGHIKGSDIRTVFPVGYLSLPKGVGFKSRTDEDYLRHIWFNILEPGTVCPAIINGKEYTNLRAPGRRLFMQAYWEHGKHCSSFSLPLDDPGMTLLESLNKSKMHLTHGFQVKDFADENVIREAIDLGEWMGSLCSNLMLIMQSYPQYMEDMPKHKAERQHFKNVAAPRSIVLRRSTTRSVRQIVVDQNRGPGVPSGREMGNHWRRGHWRRQPHGDMWELSNPDAKWIELDDGRHAHVKWIMPVYIGLEQETHG